MFNSINILCHNYRIFLAVIHYGDNVFILSIDNNPPTFRAPGFTIRTEIQSYVEPVALLTATDIDLCAPTVQQQQGDCQIINYSIHYTRDVQELLEINSHGEIFFKSLKHFKIWRSIGIINFTVLAGNVGEYAADFGSTQVRVVHGGPVGVMPVRPKVSAILAGLLYCSLHQLILKMVKLVSLNYF